MIAYGITYRNSSMYTVAIAYCAFYKQCQYCMCMHARSSIYVLLVNCRIMDNSFCMNSFWGTTSIDLA